MSSNPASFLNPAASQVLRETGEGKRDVPECLLRCLIEKKPITVNDAAAVLSECIQQIAESIQAQAVVLFLLTDDYQLKIFKLAFSTYAFGKDEARQQMFSERAHQFEQMTLSMNDTVAGASIMAGEPLIITDCRQKEDFYDVLEWAPDFLINAVVALPLKVNGDIIGCFEVINKCTLERIPLPFTPADVEWIDETSKFMARMIQRSQDGSEPTDAEITDYAARLAHVDQAPSSQKLEPDLELVEKIGEKTLKRYQIIPLEKMSGNSIKAALSNPLDFLNIQDFELVTGLRIGEKLVAEPAAVKDALLRLYPETPQIDKVAESIQQVYGFEEAVPAEVFREEQNEHSAPIVMLAHRIIEDAFTSGASDIHIEPQPRKLLVRYRIDGVCRVKLTLPEQVGRPLASRLKIMSELDIAERRLPQDGRIQYSKYNAKHDLDLRVSVAPSSLGEAIVMRILDKRKSALPLDQLGFSAYNLANYKKMILAPYGMVLHCGPTGSGKSMSLFAALREINSPEWKILTAEDPIEYTLEGVTQVQMKPAIGLTFAAALRCFLRQDPDIILVGEVRDRETAELAVEAAMTGHLLFSTLHTNDAASSISRLAEMKVERFLIASTLIGICAQRLMRRLCTCKTLVDPAEEDRKMLAYAKDGAPIGKVPQPGGCGKCDNSGYKGRTGIHELLTANDEMRSLIASGATTEQLKISARRHSMRTLFEDAMEKVKGGLSTISEALTAAIPDEPLPPL